MESECRTRKQDQQGIRTVAYGASAAVTFVNGHQAAAVGHGEVILRVQTASGCTDNTLRAVLHVPEATVNLFSTRQAMNSGAQITFRDNICFVSSDDTMTMEGVSQRDGTMVIRQSRQQPTYATGSLNSSQAIT